MDTVLRVVKSKEDMVVRKGDTKGGKGGKKVRWEEGDGGGIDKASEQLWREMKEGWRRV